MPRKLLVGLTVFVIGLHASVAVAKSALTPTQDAIARPTLLIEDDRVRFLAAEALEWRLEVADLQGQPVFDSGFVNGSVLDWTLADAQGQPVATGVYRYVVTIGRGNGSRAHRGELTVERASPAYRVAATADETTDGMPLAIVQGRPSSVGRSDGAAASGTGLAGDAATALPTDLGRASFASPQPYISGTGTTSRMTKWIDGPNGGVGDTNVTEINGNITVGNGVFKGNVHIFGVAGDDVFSGMGPDPINGPGFNYGYAGATFGRGAGFFNVRPDGSATPPNPSLRFMTANVERMIITNTGKIGINTFGTSLPAHQLRIAGGQQWTTDVWKGAVELDNGAAIGWQQNPGLSAGIGHSGGGMYFFHSQSAPGDATAAASYDMVINNAGFVGIGTTSPSAKLHVAGIAQADGVSAQYVYGQHPGASIGVYGSSVGGVRVYGSSPSGTAVIGVSDSQYGVQGISNSSVGVRGSSTSSYGVYGTSATGFAGYFSGNVYVTGTITQNSDVRLKRDVGNLHYGLREVMQLRPVSWIWNDQPSSGRQLGLIAQEIQPLIPELVTNSKDDQQILGVNYLGLMPVAIKAIQEQQTTITALQAENAALKARLAAIEQALNSLMRSQR